MHEQDDIELDTLMHHLRVEKLARNKEKKPESSEKRFQEGWQGQEEALW